MNKEKNEETKITPTMLKEIRDRTIEELQATFDLFINETKNKEKEE